MPQPVQPATQVVRLLQLVYLWVGRGGGAARLAGLVWHRSLNLATCPPTRLQRVSGDFENQPEIAP